MAGVDVKGMTNVEIHDLEVGNHSTPLRLEGNGTESVITENHSVRENCIVEHGAFVGSAKELPTEKS